LQADFRLRRTATDGVRAVFKTAALSLHNTLDGLINVPVLLPDRFPNPQPWFPSCCFSRTRRVTGLPPGQPSEP